MEKEIWKVACCKEDNILISNKGNVWNARKNKPMPTFLAGRGYKAISIGGKLHKKNYIVSRLVAIAFIPNPNNYPQVNHINGNKLDNMVENLEWCSARYNNIHAIKIGLRTYKDREKPILQIKNNIIIKEYKSLSECCRQNNYDIATISRCALHKKRCKTAYGYNWEYKENYFKKEKGIISTLV